MEGAADLHRGSLVGLAVHEEGGGVDVRERPAEVGLRQRRAIALVADGRIGT